jgi:diguanylate cyclase (GGDEF)-like protein/PAS domain S-box-containing protein
VNLPFLLLFVASSLLLLTLGAWALLVYRATRSSFGGLVLLWGLLLVSGDLFRVSIETHGPSARTSVLLAISLVGFLVTQALVLRQLFTSWVCPVLDVFLTGLAVVLTVWSLVLIPAGVGGGGGLLELLNLSTATCLLAAVGKLSGQLPTLAPFRAVEVFAFPVLHLVGVMLLLGRSWGFTDLPPILAIVVLCAAYVALAVPVVTASRRAPPRVADRSTRRTRLLPYVLVLTALVLSLGTALARQEDTARAPAFLTLCLVVAVALSVRQILTAEANAALVDAMAERERLYRSLVQDSSDLIMIADLDGRLEYVSPASELVLGAHGDEMVGRPVAEVLGVPEADLEAAVRATVDDGLHQRLDSSLTLADGVRSLESVVSVRGHTVVLNVRDVTERALLREQLHEIAFHDPLTGLFNRARFLRSVEERTAAWRIEGGDAPALLFLDLDGFKGVNDVAGHAAGDEVLRLVSARLNQITAEDAVLGRLGGDEFVVMLIGATHEEALAEAERIAEGVSQSYTVAEGSFVIGVSIGVAHGADVEEAEELLRNADLAMYAAKRTRRRTQAFEPSMHTAAVRRADSDVVHADALDDGRIELYYQPIVTMDTELPVGVEALLKWRTEDGVLGESGPLLEYAERSGRMGAVSGWVVGDSARPGRRLAGGSRAGAGLGEPGTGRSAPPGPGAHPAGRALGARPAPVGADDRDHRAGPHAGSGSRNPGDHRPEVPGDPRLDRRLRDRLLLPGVSGGPAGGRAQDRPQLRAGTAPRETGAGRGRRHHREWLASSAVVVAEGIGGGGGGGDRPSNASCRSASGTRCARATFRAPGVRRHVARLTSASRTAQALRRSPPSATPSDVETMNRMLRRPLPDCPRAERCARVGPCVPRPFLYALTRDSWRSSRVTPSCAFGPRGFLLQMVRCARPPTAVKDQR